MACPSSTLLPHPTYPKTLLWAADLYLTSWHVITVVNESVKKNNLNYLKRLFLAFALLVSLLCLKHFSHTVRCDDLAF